MTDEQKKAECQRICGDAGQRGIHRIAPEMCPVELDRWKNPERKKPY